MFALKLADGSFIWVALRAIATDEPVQVNDLKAALSQLEAKNLFTDEGDDAFHTNPIDALQALPHRSAKLGTHSLLRVVASFPVEIDLEPCVNKRSRMSQASARRTRGHGRGGDAARTRGLEKSQSKGKAKTNAQVAEASDSDTDSDESDDTVARAHLASVTEFFAQGKQWEDGSLHVFLAQAKVEQWDDGPLHVFLASIRKDLLW
ncbi:hypothetical protein C8R46DRAFT_1199014 [Mycena filopes]|nr:hypothetical protein C8R46DRAFT_1199014 [Mycena filopes]